MDAGLKDRVVLVTGASGGIGAACARAFAAERARLVLHAHRNRAAADTLASDLATPSLVVAGDLSSEVEVDRVFAEALDRFGRIDTVVANAGIWIPEAEPIETMSLDRWKRTIDANQTSVFLTLRAWFRTLAVRRPECASAVIIGSTAAVFGEEGHVEYAASKAAIVYGMTRSLKNEIVRLCPRGRINAVCPGWTRTSMAAATLAVPGAIERATRTQPLRRVAEPEDIARSVVYLASDTLAAHVSGEILTIAGGMEGRLLHHDVDESPDRS